MNVSIIKESSPYRPGEREGGSQRRQKPHRLNKVQPRTIRLKKVKREEGDILKGKHAGSVIDSFSDQEENTKNHGELLPLFNTFLLLHYELENSSHSSSLRILK